MGRFIFATAFMAMCFGAQAMPNFQSKYLCTATGGQSAVITFEVHDNKLYLIGVGPDAEKNGLACVNQPTQSNKVGALTVSIAGTCDDNKLYVETGLDMGAGSGSSMLIKFGVTKISDTQAEIKVSSKGNMNGDSLDAGETFNCVK